MRMGRIPDVNLVRNPFVIQNAIELLILAQALVVPTGGEHILVAPKTIEKPWIREAGQIVRGQMEVAIVVVIAVEKTGEVKCARQRDKSSKDLRVAQGDIDRVIAAETASKREKARVRVLLADEWDDFVHNVFLILDVARDALARRRFAVVPAFVVDGVDAEEL